MTIKRWNAKRDTSEAGIVKALRQAGATVFLMDVPTDLLIGHRGKNYLAEVKNPAKTSKRDPSKKLKPTSKINEKQASFMAEWRGQVAVIRTPDEAINLINGDTE